MEIIVQKVDLKNPFPLNSLLCNGKFLWTLKVLHITINANKKPLFVTVYTVSVNVEMFKTNTVFFLIWMKQHISQNSLRYAFM